MKKNTTSIVMLVVASLSLGACKKKGEQQEATGKTVEGPAASGSAATGAAAATDTPTPAAGSSAEAPKPTAPATVLDAAQQAGSFTTFLKAVDAAGITENLKGAGPFTVFAPTDEAFAKIPKAELDALLADKAKLAGLLQYHVVSGSVASKDLTALKVATSVAGPELAIDATSGLKVGGATVIKPDLAAGNGVVHAIDTVLTPPAK